jgi:hypothetical protein
LFFLDNTYKLEHFSAEASGHLDDTLESCSWGWVLIKAKVKEQGVEPFKIERSQETRRCIRVMMRVTEHFWDKW